MEFLTNPWVIIAIVLAVIIGNISALKYTANMKVGQMKKKPPQNKHENEQETDQKDPPS